MFVEQIKREPADPCGDAAVDGDGNSFANRRRHRRCRRQKGAGAASSSSAAEGAAAVAAEGPR